MLRQILINMIIFVVYVLNLKLHTQNPHYHSQHAEIWNLISAHDSRPIYPAPTYIAVLLLGPHQLHYIESILYKCCVCVLSHYSRNLALRILLQLVHHSGRLRWYGHVQRATSCMCMSLFSLCIIMLLFVCVQSNPVISRAINLRKSVSRACTLDPKF